MKWVCSDIISALGLDPKNYLFSNEPISRVATDSRDIRKGDIFFAIPGDNFDGHDFVSLALESGASVAVVMESSASRYDSETSQKLIVVKDTVISLGQFATWWRTQLSCPVISITGSAGKTTTKEIARVLFSEIVGHGTASDKSLNNHLGLPLTILSADKADKWIILEAGMNHVGELSYLGDIAKPDFVLLTNVGLAHVGNFASVGDVGDAKCELLARVKNSGAIVFNGLSVDALEAVRRNIKSGNITCPNIISLFDNKSDNEFGGVSMTDTLVSQNGTQAKVSINSPLLDPEITSIWDDVSLSVPFVGKHFIQNALLAVTSLLYLYPNATPEQVNSALGKIEPPDKRFQVSFYGKLTLIDDSYNANPLSMKASLESAAKVSPGSRFIAILGQMLELGDQTKEQHFDIGKFAAEVGVTDLITFGASGVDYIQGYRSIRSDGDTAEASDIDELYRLVKQKLSNIESPTSVFIKGSRGNKLERVVTYIKTEVADRF